MKHFILAAMVGIPVMLAGQSGFSPEAYMQFRQENRGLTTAELLQQHPPQTTYYSSRKYPVDLSQVAWFDTIDQAYAFTKDERALLETNKFMVTERISSDSWLDAYVGVYNQDLPLFLGTDFILFTLHQSYDEILKTLEYKMLEPNLLELLQAMYATFPDTYTQYKDIPELALSLGDVDLYISVALSLLTGEKYAPRYNATSDYTSVMEAIASEQMVVMPLFTREDLDRKLDFSQFKPRGHYTDELYYSPEGSRTLENYFRAMMWLGRIDFLVTPPPENPWEPPWKRDDILRMNLSALLLNEVLFNCGKTELLEKHEEVISFLVGEDDNLTPAELHALSDTHLSGVSDLLDAQHFDMFLELLNSSDDYGQKIMSNFFLADPDSSDPGHLPVSFRLLGQKFLVDSYIFSEVVFDRITHNGVKQFRMIPDPLDILSVFGNENAMMLMEEEMVKYKYAYKVNELKYLVDAYDEEYWTRSLYNTWLSAIMKLNPPASGNGLPYFMQTTAWHHAKLNTQLTSWAQLRHDNILYAKQSYTGGTGCSYPFTYVEPYPEFYAYISTFAANAAAFFEDLLATSDPELAQKISGYYDRYGEIMDKLEGIAGKELAGESLSEDELVFLKTMINDYMASGPSVSGWITHLLFPAMDALEPDFTVADVHTQPTEPGGAPVGKVLHVGNGRLNIAVVIAPCNTGSGGQMAFVGPVGSFHTAITRDFYRLNDDEWEQLFMEGNPPERPGWAYAYLANARGDTIVPDQVLKGVQYTGIDHVPSFDREMEYMLLYPNPATDRLHARFILNNTARVSAGMYDMSGRLVKSFFRGWLPADEHDLEVPLEGTTPGVYFIRLEVNGQGFVKKGIINGGH
ncbi:MAG: DUF3160 domain-containing protein [Bacteroidales bacterium]|nr:DUF3160 domain-containing protein [Bacteroidales bacterium]